MQYKIIFAGPVGAGKTTAIASISDIPVVSTERHATDEVQQLKQNTTVAMDYGLLKLDDDLRVHLYGSPGQERFDFMWDILANGALGLVLLIDHSRENAEDDLRRYITSFSDCIRRSGAAVVIGITRLDLIPGSTLGRYRKVASEFGLNCPIFEVDAREQQDVRQLLLALLGILHPAVQQKPNSFSLPGGQRPALSRQG